MASDVEMLKLLERLEKEVEELKQQTGTLWLRGGGDGLPIWIDVT
jgi:hypothetical protein